MIDRFYALSHQGLVRSSNQDHILTDEALGLWAVADGMGGHCSGDIASRMACEVLRRSISQRRNLVVAFEQAHAAVRVMQERDPAMFDMGTTLVAVLESDVGFELAWVGDSRAYLFSPKNEDCQNGQLQLLTSDQNVASRLFERGEITADQARNHPHRNVLTDCIGQREGEPRIESKSIRWEKGDCLLLCSDGLSGEVDATDLQEIMASNRSLDLIGQSLVNRALSAGGGDNIAVVLLHATAAT